MAVTSGSFNTTGYYDPYSPDHMQFSWSLISQDISSNTSKISWSLTAQGGVGGGYYNTIKEKYVTVNGTTKSNSTATRVYLGTELFSGETTIAHNADGSGSFSASAGGAIEFYGSYNSTGSGSWTLPTIARQATLSSASNFSDISNPTITYSNPAGNAVSSLQACISFTGAAADVPYRDVSKTGTSYTFSLTDTEKATLKNHFPSATSGNVLIYLKTVIGSSTFYSSKTVTFSIANNATNQPSVSITVSPDNSNIPSTYRSEFNGVYIASKSKIRVQTTASGKFSASISSRGLTIDGTSYGNVSADYTTSGPITNSGNNKSVSMTVKDSRGYSSTASKTINVYTYMTPYISNPVCYRGTSSGRDDTKTTVYISATKSFASINNINKCVLQYRSKAENGSWSNWSELSGRSGANAYSGTLSGFSLTSSYTIQLRVTDDVGNTSEALSFNIPAEGVPLELYPGGRRVGIGSHAKSIDYTIVNGWATYFDDQIYIKVADSYVTLADYIRSIH